MDINDFEKTWEVEYICSRVKMVREAVSKGRYEDAKDMLNMIQEKAKSAEYEISNHQK